MYSGGNFFGFSDQLKKETLDMWLAFALSAAICFGLRGILYQWTSQRPLDRNLMLLGVYLSGATVSFVAALALGQAWSPAALTGVVMGTFSFISNASMYKGFSVGNPSLVAIFTALTPVVVAGVSFLLWGEKLNPLQALALAVIVVGVVIIRYSSDLSWRNLQGVQWALLSMATFGMTDMASKQAMLWHAEKMVTLTVMFSTGAVLFFVSWSLGAVRTRAARQAKAMAAAAAAAAAQQRTPAASGSEADSERPEEKQVRASAQRAEADASRPALHSARSEAEAPVPWSAGRTIGWGATVGLSNVAGMMLILPAFERGITGLVSAVMATNVLLILLYIRLFLKERWTPKQMLGMLCSLLGVLGLRLME